MKDTLDASDRLRAEYDALPMARVVELPAEAAVCTLAKRALARGAPSEVEVQLCLVDRLLHLVGHGGFDHYFSLPASDLAPQTVEALVLMGCQVLADVLQRAMAAFPGGIMPARLEDRTATMTGPDSPVDAWDPLDSLFYSGEAHALNSVLAYLSKNVDLPPLS